MALSKRQARLIYYEVIILGVILAIKLSGYGDNDSNSTQSVSTGRNNEKDMA